ncbi:uncharacterized protein METZ01_LOCUS498026, partial [marine metagenome]
MVPGIHRAGHNAEPCLPDFVDQIKFQPSWGQPYNSSGNRRHMSDEFRRIGWSLGVDKDRPRGIRNSFGALGQNIFFRRNDHTP